MKTKAYFTAILFMVSLIWANGFESITQPSITIKQVDGKQGGAFGSGGASGGVLGSGSSFSTKGTSPDSAGSEGVASGHTTVFEEYFEGLEHPDDMFLKIVPPRWTDMHKTHTGNNFTFATDKVKNGEQSMKFVAEGTEDPNKVSKSSIKRDVFRFNPGDEVKISAWFYIPSGQSIKDVTLMDLECMKCWDEKKNIYENKSPGLRVQVADSKGTLEIDRGKIGYRYENFEQPDDNQVALPRDRWTHIEWVVKLGMEGEGMTRLFLDDEEIIASSGTNLADPVKFKEFYIVLEDTIMYDTFEVGISANQQNTEVELYVDDVVVGVK